MLDAAERGEDVIIERRGVRYTLRAESARRARPRRRSRRTPNCQFPTPNAQKKSQLPRRGVLEVGSWQLGVDPDYFERASGRIWNLMIFAVVPLPPSMWKGARVANVL